MSLEGVASAENLLRGKINSLDALTISAYAIAVKNGFEGTEAEWLASLKGDKGDDGDSCTITATETEDGVRLGIYNTPSGGGATYTPVLIKHGEKGDPGTSVTVKAVAESTADGGINMVTFSDGKTLTIKNGSKGDPGAVQTVNGIAPDENGNVVVEGGSNGGGAGWTTAQINLLDSLFSAIPWTTSTAGALADSLIASLRSTSSGGGTGGGSGGEAEDTETDNITQSGSTLIITSLATAPTQSGGVLTIA